jgi:hypothetical protein
MGDAMQRDGPGRTRDRRGRLLRTTVIAATIPIAARDRLPCPSPPPYCSARWPSGRAEMHHLAKMDDRLAQDLYLQQRPRETSLGAPQHRPIDPGSRHMTCHSWSRLLGPASSASTSGTPDAAGAGRRPRPAAAQPRRRRRSVAVSRTRPSVTGPPGMDTSSPPVGASQSRSATLSIAATPLPFPAPAPPAARPRTMCRRLAATSRTRLQRRRALTRPLLPRAQTGTPARNANASAPGPTRKASRSRPEAASART